MARIRSKFSKRQAGQAVAVDVLALSPQARQRTIVLSATAPLVVQNASKYLSATCPFTSGFKVVDAWVNFVTLPVCSGGTSTLAIDKVATDGSTTTSIVAAADILSGYTAKVPKQQTLAATVTLTAGQSILVTVATSNNTVGTADVGASVTLVVEPIEDDPISDSNTSV